MVHRAVGPAGQPPGLQVNHQHHIPSCDISHKFIQKHIHKHIPWFLVLFIAPFIEISAVIVLWWKVGVVPVTLVVPLSNWSLVGIPAVLHRGDGIVVEVLAVRRRPGEELVQSEAIVCRSQLDLCSSHVDMRPVNNNQ